MTRSDLPKSKGLARDEDYLIRRKTVSERLGPQELWSVIDHWPLYVGVSNLARYLAIYEILKRQRSVPGDIVEFGSWKGANLLFMAKCMEVLDPRGAKRVHCFDNFAGLPKFSSPDGPELDRAGTYRGNLENLREMLALYELDDTVEIHEGAIEQTLPAALDADESMSFSTVYFDADIYEPAMVVLTRCHDRLVKGGAFIFDEWNYSVWPGETVAVREFMAIHGDSYSMESVPGTRQPSLLMRKLR